MTDIEELGRRVAEAMGPVRRLDAMIHAIFVPADFPDEDAAHYATYPQVNRADMRYLNEMLIPYYTSSIDAALALVERMLPGYIWGIHCHAGAYRAHVTKNSALRPMPNIADAPTPPLAIIAALLKALSSIRPNGGAEE